MTEADWLNSITPGIMLEFLHSPRPSPPKVGFFARFLLGRSQPAPLQPIKPSDRKLRLFACACCRRVWDLLKEPRSRNAVAVAERFAEGQAGLEELNAARAAAEAVCLRTRHTRVPDWGAEAAWRTTSQDAAVAARDAALNARGAQSAPRIASEAFYLEGIEQAELLRDIAGNPFRSLAPPEHWPPVVTKLAESLYAGEDCHFALHDALEEAGLSDWAEHFRKPGHPKGCWAVDKILGKT
jgi:hypothetical protein